MRIHGKSVRGNRSVDIKALLEKLPEKLMVSRIWKSARHANDGNICLPFHGASLGRDL